LYIPLACANGFPGHFASKGQGLADNTLVVLWGESVKTDRYRYTRWPGQDGEPVHMLYDHRTDPAENTNIAANPTHAATVTRMRKLLAAGYKTALPKSI
jgi:arylsulfatase A-like enzyme